MAAELDRVFHYHAIENYPNKALMALRVVDEVKRSGRCRGELVIVYIDDRELHLHDIGGRLGGSSTLRRGTLVEM